MKQQPTIFLHIGQPKTGTSAIQTFLKTNRTLLKKQGFTYPRHCHHLSRLWDDDQTAAREARSAWEAVKDLVDGPDHLILSNEGLGEILFSRPKSLRDILSYLGNRPVRVVLYLRRQDLHLESYYRQLVRGGSFVTPFGPTAIDAMVHPGYYDYAEQIRSLEGQFGRENIILRIYDRNGFFGGDLATDFCQAVGLEWLDEFTLAPGNENPSIDARLTGLLLAANAAIPSQGGRLREFKELIDSVEEFTFKDRESRLLSSDDRAAMLARFHRGNTWIARRYFNREELFDTANLEALGEPRKLADNDMYLLLFNLNAAWAQGMGAVPFPLYNRLKVAHLTGRMPSASGADRDGLCAEPSIFRVLNRFFGKLCARRNRCGSRERTVMRYIRKNADMVREKGATLLR